MSIEKGAKNRRAEEQQLLRNYSILKMIEIKPKDHYIHSIGGFLPYYAYNKDYIEKYKNRIKDGDPKTISIIYHKTEYENENEFYYLVENNHLTIDLWHPNYEEGLKMVSGYWAIRCAAKTPHDIFKKYSLLIKAFIYIILYSLLIVYFRNCVFSSFSEWPYFNSINSINSIIIQ